MHKFNNMTDEEILAKIHGVTQAHENKKLEIRNLTLMTDKKIAELTDIEKEYADLVLELHKRGKNVVR
jgi:hypothetical protein